MWLSAQASAPSAAARIAAPITSNRRCSRRSSGAKDSRIATATSASGGLIQNTDGQPKVSVSQPPRTGPPAVVRSEEHTSELLSLMRISYAVFCLKKKKQQRRKPTQHTL